MNSKTKTKNKKRATKQQLAKKKKAKAKAKQKKQHEIDTVMSLDLEDDAKMLVTIDKIDKSFRLTVTLDNVIKWAGEIPCNGMKALVSNGQTFLLRTLMYSKNENYRDCLSRIFGQTKKIDLGANIFLYESRENDIITFVKEDGEGNPLDLDEAESQVIAKAYVAGAFAF